MPLPIKKWVVGDYEIERRRPADDYWFRKRKSPAYAWKFGGYTLAQAKKAVQAAVREEFD